MLIDGCWLSIELFAGLYWSLSVGAVSKVDGYLHEDHQETSQVTLENKVQSFMGRIVSVTLASGC